MIKYVTLALGVTMMAGSGLVAIANDTPGAASDDPGLNLLLRWENRVARTAYDQTNNADPRRAALPQKTGQGASKKHYSSMTGEEELREIAKHNPHVKEYIDLLDARQRDAKWARVRHKVDDKAGAKGRLGDIHNRPPADGKVRDVSMEEFDRMSTLEQYRHRSTIKPLRSKENVGQGSGITWKQKRD